MPEATLVHDSETIIAPSTDSSASRFWGGTMVAFPLVANCSSFAQTIAPAASRSLPY